MFFKSKRIYLFVILFLFVITSVSAQSSRYSVDNAKPRHASHFSIRRLFYGNPTKKAKRKEARKKRKDIRQLKREKKKFLKRKNYGKAVGSNKRVYKRMRKNLRETKKGYKKRRKYNEKK
jgi:hypothetical protein